MKKRLLCMLILAAGFSGCGGSGSGDKTANANGSAVVTQGMITGFGSVIVNGVHYDVSDASILVDDKSLVESDLEVGQMVRIIGSLDKEGHKGKALSLIGETQLRGPIGSIDLTTGVIVVLGQTILINDDTFYKDGLTADQLKVGDIIRVSSFTNDEGKLVATRIDLKLDDTGSFQVSGAVSSLDSVAMTFKINDLTVDYSKANLANLSKPLENGTLVNLRGSLVDGVFVAVGNLQKSCFGFRGEKGLPDRVVVSGLVAELVANTSFVIGDTKVLLSADTQFEYGTVTDLLDGVSIKVSGKLDAENNLVASKIKFKHEPKIDSRGLVEAIDLTAQTFTVNGLVFKVTEDTSFKDSGFGKVRFFDLEDLAVGDLIRARGYNQPSTSTGPEVLVATRVERRVMPSGPKLDGDFSLEIEGKVEAVGTSSVTIAGKEILLDANTKIEGFTDLAALLATAVGLEVEVRVIMKDGQLVAIKLELETTESHS
jgi:Domain of unknown function (DUF5666)